LSVPSAISSAMSGFEFGVRTIAPVDAIRLGQRCDVLDPGDQPGVACRGGLETGDGAEASLAEFFDFSGATKVLMSA